MTRARRRRDQARLPDPRAQGQRQAPRLPRLRRRRRRSRSRCSTRWTTRYRNHYANIHRGVYTIAEEATAAFEDARRKVARFVNAPPHRRDRLHAQRDRVDQPRRVHVGAREPAGRRRDRALAHGAPRQRRPVAHARRRARHRAAVDPADRPTSASTSPNLDALLDGATPARDQRDVERARHDQRHPPARRRRARRTARSCSSTRASSCRTSPPTCRPGTPTSSRSPRTRSSARPASARSGRAASCSRRCRRSSAAAR